MPSSLREDRSIARPAGPRYLTCAERARDSGRIRITVARPRVALEAVETFDGVGVGRNHESGFNVATALVASGRSRLNVATALRPWKRPRPSLRLRFGWVGGLIPVKKLIVCP